MQCFILYTITLYFPELQVTNWDSCLHIDGNGKDGSEKNSHDEQSAQLHNLSHGKYSYKMTTNA